MALQEYLDLVSDLVLELLVDSAAEPESVSVLAEVAVIPAEAELDPGSESDQLDHRHLELELAPALVLVWGSARMDSLDCKEPDLVRTDKELDLV